jgi:hypothetical protein
MRGVTVLVSTEWKLKQRLENGKSYGMRTSKMVARTVGTFIEKCKKIRQESLHVIVIYIP